MPSKKIPSISSSAGCIFAQSRHLGRMEVRQYRTGGFLLAALVSAGPLLAQLPTNLAAAKVLATNAIANSNGLKAAFPANRELDNQHRLRAGDKLSFRVAEDGEEAK